MSFPSLLINLMCIYLSICNIIKTDPLKSKHSEFKGNTKYSKLSRKLLENQKQNPEKLTRFCEASYAVRGAPKIRCSLPLHLSLFLSLPLHPSISKA